MIYDLIVQAVLDEDVKKLSKLSASTTSSFTNDFEQALQKSKLQRQTRTEEVPGDLLALDYLFYLGLTTEEGDTGGIKQAMHLLDRPALADELPG